MELPGADAIFSPSRWCGSQPIRCLALVRRGLGVGPAEVGGQACDADVLHHLRLHRLAAEDGEFGLHHLIVVEGRAARRVAEGGLVDVFLTETDQKAGAGRISGVHLQRNEKAQREDHDKNDEHQRPLPPKERQHVGGQIARRLFPAGDGARGQWDGDVRPSR